MSGNYPDGVTGREPQIAGYDEVEVERLCESERYDVVPEHMVTEAVGTALGLVRQGLDQSSDPVAREWLARASDVLAGLARDVGDESFLYENAPLCPTEIIDDVLVDQHGAGEVQCRTCGTVHAVDLSWQ